MGTDGAGPVAARLAPAAILLHSLRLYREHWRMLLTVSATIFVPLGLLAPAVAPLGRPGLIGATIVNLTAMFLVQGALVWLVAHLHGGRRDDDPPTARAVFNATRHRFAALLLAGLVAGASVIVGLALLIVPGLLLLTWWVVLPPVVVLERLTLFASLRRAQTLVGGHLLRVFAIAVATMAIQLVFGLLVNALTMPLGAPIADLITVSVGSMLAAPLIALAWTLTYFALVPDGHTAPHRTARLDPQPLEHA